MRKSDRPAPGAVDDGSEGIGAGVGTAGCVVFVVVFAGVGTSGLASSLRTYDGRCRARRAANPDGFSASSVNADELAVRVGVDVGVSVGVGIDADVGMVGFVPMLAPDVIRFVSTFSLTTSPVPVPLTPSVAFSVDFSNSPSTSSNSVFAASFPLSTLNTSSRSALAPSRSPRPRNATARRYLAF